MLLNSLLLSVLVLLYSVRAQDDETETGINVDEATEGMFGGDVKLSPDQLSEMIARSKADDTIGGIQRAVLDPDLISPWPNAIVPYVLDSNLNVNARTAITAAMTQYEDNTCIRFVVRSNEADFVRFFPGRGCYSYIGRVGGSQEISIGNGCEYVGIVIHEIFHALGRFHEQSRPDRDLYITIDFNNIQSGFEDNFNKQEGEYISTQGEAYDFGSVMHYRASAFAEVRGSPTIIPLPEHNIPLDSLGQRTGFSETDIVHAIKLNCPDTLTYGEWSGWSQWAACSQTCNGGTRARSRTCSTDTCNGGDDTQIEDCQTQQCVQEAEWGQWTAWSMCTEECGGGQRNRIRTCMNGNTCPGQDKQYEDCNQQTCPPEQMTQWSSWSSWGACSKTCDDNGMQTRTRRCVNGNTCQGVNFETSTCNEDISCKPGTTEWSEWSECSRTCDGGARARTKSCSGGSDTSVCSRETQPCGTEDCPDPEPKLRGIRRRGCYVVPQFATPLRLLENSTPDLSDNPTTRRFPIEKCGVAATLQDLDYFAISIGYCISGSNNINDYFTFPINNEFLCQNGKGGYSSGYFFMEVYELEDIQSFMDSVALTQPETSPSPSPTPDGASLSLSSTMLISLTVLISICYILFN